MIKLFEKHKKDPIIEVMDGEMPKAETLDSAKRLLAADNPPEVRRKRLFRNIAFAAAPIVLTGVLITVKLTVVLPKAACGSTVQNDSVNEAAQDYLPEESANIGGDWEVPLGDYNAYSTETPAKYPEDFDGDCLKLTSGNSGLTFYYEETSENYWYAVALKSDGMYMVVTGHCSQASFEAYLGNI